MIIKKYLPINVKKAICEQILENALVEKNGLLYEDFINKEIALYISLCQFYTDMDMTDFNYDLMNENGTLQFILDEIPASEINFFNSTLDSMIKQEIGIHNSVGAVLDRSIGKMLDKLPDEKGIKKIIADIPKQVNKIKPDNLQLLIDIFGKKEE